MIDDTGALRYPVDLEPVGKRAEIPPGASLLAAAQNAGVELVSLCGGIGACDSCRVMLMEGELTPPTIIETSELTEEELTAGMRLACQSYPKSPVKLYIPAESLTTPQRLQVEGEESEVELDPVVAGVEIQIPPPSLDDLRADSTRFKDALAEAGYDGLRVPLPVLRDLSRQLRKMDWAVKVAVREGEVVGVFPAGSPLLGLAIDIGTTKVAAYLVDLETGTTLAKAGEMNPQIGYGEDVIARISYVIDNPDGARVLQESLVEVLNKLGAQLCEEVGLEPSQIVEVVAVGNTAMHHLLAGFPVAQLGLAPYVPAVSVPYDLRAADIGMVTAPAAYVHLPPNIAGYVGADHVAMVLATDISETADTVIALDIGTNTEISLTNGDRVVSCSCASGPAFEGAHIKNGMRAAPGAIERIQIDEGDIRYKTIGDQPPVGICGSGILDAVAELSKARIIDGKGSFIQGADRVRKAKQNYEYLLVSEEDSGHERDIVVTRRDINEIQLAKAAIRAGIEILLVRAGVKAADIKQFIVAGAFGTYIDVTNAMRIGMFPDLPMETIRQVGNAAGVGAKQMLLSKKRRQEAAQAVDEIEYIELTTDPQFSGFFMEAMFLEE